MFTEHLPFGYEETVDPAMVHPRISTPPAAEYNQYPIHGSTSRPQSMCEPESGSTTTSKPVDTVPGLFSSPSLTYPIRDTGTHTNHRDSFNDHTFPSLPELVADQDDSDDAIATSTGDEAVTPSEEKRDPTSTLMRCPECQSILKWLFVDELQNGKHHIHRCQASCTCGDTKRQPIEHYGPVLVSRGAW
ncbi:hypothetical protein LTR36_005761 [Oleoguttula mirabilis]|uniref:Uncharacterized protein n=1 Tax=Oleoguttula mirabilis TaxID=1507867 RepID=A0AAV9JDJ8_9PEZI|nr:hypothetical protein LTR36_005761 [Oleoguttula mirabilis]